MAVILNGRTSRNAVSAVEEVESRVARENATTLCLAVVEWTANTWDQVQRQEHVANVPVVNQWSTLVGHFLITTTTNTITKDFEDSNDDTQAQYDNSDDVFKEDDDLLTMILSLTTKTRMTVTYPFPNRTTVNCQLITS